MRISGSGILIVGGEAFRWRPWVVGEGEGGGGGKGKEGRGAMEGRLRNAKGQFEVPSSVWGVLDLVYPKPGTSPCVPFHLPLPYLSSLP